MKLHEFLRQAIPTEWIIASGHLAARAVKDVGESGHDGERGDSSPSHSSRGERPPEGKVSADGGGFPPRNAGGGQAQRQQSSPIDKSRERHGKRYEANNMVNARAIDRATQRG